MTERAQMRLIAGLTVCSTPISGIITFAIVAVILGENQLEGAQGMTTLGLLATLIPALIGFVLFLWSFTSAPAPNRRSLSVAGLAAGVALLGLGAWSLFNTEAGDANIGGALLIFLAVLLGAAGVFGLRQSND